MRLLLAQNLHYYPTFGGANKANRSLFQQLAASGVECVVVAPVADSFQRGDVPVPPGMELHRRATRADIYLDQGVEAHLVQKASDLGPYVLEAVRERKPDLIVVPSDDPGLVVLSAALEAGPDRVAYFAHTVMPMPFGPFSYNPSAAATEKVRQTVGAVGPSRYAADYVQQWAGIESAVVPLPIYGDGPFPRLGRRDGSVTMINPCSLKGMDIFLALADHFPDVAFKAVPTWGTTDSDRRRLRAQRNVEVVAPQPDIGRVLAGSSVLLMPSLAAETFGLTAVEAMVRGVPVLGADLGALPEAKLGVPYLLPVRPIDGYRRDGEFTLTPEPIVPPQDLSPWRDALRRLTSDERHYEEIAAASRDAAHDYVAGIGIEQVSEAFEGLVARVRSGKAPRARTGRAKTEHAKTSHPKTAHPKGMSVSSRVATWSPQRRALLERLLDQRTHHAPVAVKQTFSGTLTQISPGTGAPVVVIDFARPGVTSMLSQSLRSHPWPVFRIDVLGDLVADGTFQDFPQLVGTYAAKIRAENLEPAAILGDCSAAPLALAVAGALETPTFAPAAVLVDPNWPTPSGVMATLRELRRNTGASETSFTIDWSRPPAAVLDAMAALLRDDIAQAAARDGWPAAEIGKVADTMVARYRAWLGLVLASATAGIPPRTKHFTVVARSGHHDAWPSQWNQCADRMLTLTAPPETPLAADDNCAAAIARLIDQAPHEDLPAPNAADLMVDSFS